MSEPFLRQLVLEKKAVTLAAEKYRATAQREFEAGRGATMTATQKVISTWFPTLIQAIEVRRRRMRMEEENEDVDEGNRW